MSVLNLRSIAIGGILAALYGHSAVAEPLVSQSYDATTPFVCDSREQTAQVVQALQAHSFRERLIALGQRTKNEAVCPVSVGRIVT
jgi:hypothetical protein